MPFDEFLSFSRDISHGTGGMQILVGLKNYLMMRKEEKNIGTNNRAITKRTTTKAMSDLYRRN
jgi:hypothetical protein